MVDTLEFNRLGICNTCGRVGAYDIGRNYRCDVCVESRETALLEAARMVLEYRESKPEYLEHAIDARLGAAVKHYEETTLYARGGD